VLSACAGTKGSCILLVQLPDSVNRNNCLLNVKPEGKDHLEDPGVGGRIILRWIFRKWDVESMDWIELVQDRERWLPRVSRY
jgi:hypothetical protein